MARQPKKRIRQQRTLGAFVKIPLDEKYHSYARIIEDASFAVYDMRTSEDIEDMHAIAARPILFFVGVYDDAVTRGRWLKVGKLPLESEIEWPPPNFIQSSINPKRFQIYEHGEMRPAMREECEGLECAAVWEPEQVEQRIRDHYAGVPNEGLVELRIKDDLE